MENFVKIYRYDSMGFNCKPYTSRAFHHACEFIDTEITNLFNIENSIPNSYLHRPALDDSNWSGCFCFLNEYNHKCVSKDGTLAMRQYDKLNVKLLSEDELIWVRNCSHLGKDRPYFDKFLKRINYEDKEYCFTEGSTFASYRWVKMKVNLALKRTQLWKEQNEDIPEWLTEFYLMEDQLENLLPVPYYEKFNYFFKNALRLKSIKF